jgi:hypothetical protein
VKAIKEGYYENSRRRVGSRFILKDAAAFSKLWMKPVEEADESEEVEQEQYKSISELPTEI